MNLRALCPSSRPQASEGRRASRIRACLTLSALLLLPVCQRPNVPSPPTPSAPSSQPSASASAALVPVPKAQELLQTEPPDIEQLVWALDGKSFAVVNQREVLLYDATTREHTATLDAQEISAAKGGGFVGVSRATWRPTLWGSDGRELASLPEASPPPSSDEVTIPLLVSANGQIAVQRLRKDLRATVWDVERRRIVQTFTASWGAVLSNSGRYLASQGAAWSHTEPSFLVDTLTGERLPLPSTFSSDPPRPLSPIDQDGFLFMDEKGYSSVLPDPLQVRAIRLPASVGPSALRFFDADVVLMDTGKGSLIWNTKSQKVIRRLDGESPQPTVDGEGRYFVTRSEVASKPRFTWDYLVHSTQDGKLLAEFSGNPPLVFRPTTDELTQLDDADNLVSRDVKTHETRFIAPRGRLEKLGAIDLDATGQRLVIGMQGAALVWTREASRTVTVPGLFDVRWGTGSEFATLANTPRGSCSLQLWTAMSERPRKTQELECGREGQWEFSPNPGFLRHEAELTPEVRQLALRYGLADLGASKVWVTEEKAFEALDQPGRPLSLRVRPKRFDHVVDVRGNPKLDDDPPYTAQLAFLTNQRVVKLLGDADLTLYAPGPVSADLACDFLRRSLPVHSKSSGGSELSPRHFGFDRARAETLLFAHDGRSVVADFAHKTCRRYPAPEVTVQSPRIQPESGALAPSGRWLATLSQEGALTLWDLEHDTHLNVALTPAISARRLVASADDRFVVVSDARQVYFVRTRDAEWLRLRWLSEGGQTQLLYDSSEGRYAGTEQALAKVRLRVEQAGAAPLLLDLATYEARFSAGLRDDELVERFFR